MIPRPSPVQSVLKSTRDALSLPLVLRVLKVRIQALRGAVAAVPPPTVVAANVI